MPSGGKRKNSGRPKTSEVSNRQLQAENLKLTMEMKRLDIEKMKTEQMIKNGNLWHKDVVMNRLAELLTITKQKLQSLPRKLAIQCQQQEAVIIEDLLTKEIRNALLELSTYCGEKAEGVK